MLVITQCCIHELYLQGREQQAAVDIAKTFERRKCNHREAIPGDECLSSVVGVSLVHYIRFSRLNTNMCR
jgi:U3 small nucleolar RNA-associated protein 23